MFALAVDWTIPVSTIIVLAVQFAGGLVAIMRAFASIEKSIDGRFNEMTLKLNTFKEGDLRDVMSRLARLETGADEWTKALRERTHDHANQLNALTLEIDRLKRPINYDRRGD